MSITAEKFWEGRDALIAQAKEALAKSGSYHGLVRVRADELLFLLQQGEPEGWREAKRIADLWFEPWGAAKAIEWEFSGDVPFTPENALRKIQRLLSASPLPPAPGAETLSEMVERKCKADVPDRALATPPAEGETK